MAMSLFLSMVHGNNHDIYFIFQILDCTSINKSERAKQYFLHPVARKTNSVSCLLEQNLSVKAA